MPTGNPEFGAVRPDNVPRRAARRDPDETPAPATTSAAVQPEPGGPGPTVPVPAPEPGTPSPPPVPGNSAVAPSVPAGDGGTLATVLTAPNHAPGGHQVSQGVAALANLAAMRTRPVDPMQDWAADGTRLPRWLLNAMRQYAMLTGRKMQDVERDALLGTDPIPDDVLDANWLDCYGFPRDRYDPLAYR